SGSVQLLMEAEHAQTEDLRLMGIVVKEVDRLNGLLTDFLGFARPRQPLKELVNVASILDQLIDMLATDHRFEGVEIKQYYSDDLNLTLDRGLILQALWDLAINATEAMKGCGELIFSVEKQNFPSIIVEDNGPGIADEIKGRIFEPFFSTKERGTGLGLASVYSALEAHDGMVTVDSRATGGARFSLQFAVGQG
ncbi:MAG: ATP-binding protein, partial [Thermodesulfobacteriota bacterium]|nr:ATP-binding protein [Thermodesulfobacteriota bacterium]